MYRLQDAYSDRVDFFHLDVDKAETKAVRDQFGLVRRSQYALIDAEGNVIKTWAGPLNEEAIFTDIEMLLQELETFRLGEPAEMLN